MVRRGGVEGHALPPPGAAQTWNSAHQSAGNVEAPRRVSASLGEAPVGFASFHLWAFLPPSLFLPVDCEKPSGSSPGRWVGFSVATGESVPG